MNKVSCSHLVPHCAAQFDGSTEREVIEQYAAHASAEHPEPVALLALLEVIVAA